MMLTPIRASTAREEENLVPSCTAGIEVKACLCLESHVRCRLHAALYIETFIIILTNVLTTSIVPG
jgi:hypothetical protein